MTIAVDFDGTIVTHHYPYIGDLQPGAKEALQALKDAGHTIVIWSCRSNRDRNSPYNMVESGLNPPYWEMVDFLNTNKIPYDVVDDGTCGKIHADLYIDDRAVPYDGSWGHVLTTIALRGVKHA